MLCGRVGSSCSTIGTRRFTVVKNPAICQETGSEDCDKRNISVDICATDIP
jgi:hypothetical protein